MCGKSWSSQQISLWTQWLGFYALTMALLDGSEWGIDSVNLFLIVDSVLFILAQIWWTQTKHIFAEVRCLQAL